MVFRIAIGRCDCRAPYNDPADEKACETIQQTLDDWRSRLPSDLGSIPAENSEEQFIEGRRVTFSVYKIDGGRGTLVVYQALVHSWKRPTLLSIGTVGRLYAEGLLVTGDSEVHPAPDDLMWQFR